MLTVQNGKISSTQILFPVSMMAFVLLLTMSFQLIQIAEDHHALKVAREQQEKPLADVERVQAQLNALGSGTFKLAQQGNKPAQAIIERLKAAGVIAPQQNQAVGGPAGAPPPPGAMMQRAPGGPAMQKAPGSPSKPPGQ